MPLEPVAGSQLVLQRIVDRLTQQVARGIDPRLLLRYGVQ